MRGERHDDTDQRVSSAFGRSTLRWLPLFLPQKLWRCILAGVLFVDVRDARELQREGLIHQLSTLHEACWSFGLTRIAHTIARYLRRIGVLFCTVLLGGACWRARPLLRWGNPIVCHIQDGFFAWRDTGGAIATYTPQDKG